MSEALYQPFPLPNAARAHVWHHVPETRRPRHFHSEPELNLIAAGTGLFGVADSTIAVSPGDLLWWAPGQDHVLLEASLDFDLYVIGSTPEFSNRVLGDQTKAAYGGPLRRRLGSDVLQRFITACALPMGTRDTAVTERRIGDLWKEAHGVRGDACEWHALTRRALVSLLERPELSRAGLALSARGYPTEVSRYFHRDMRLTLGAYRTRLRLLRFIDAVDAGAPNLLTAGLEAGFGSYSQCHRAFRQTLGCSPQQFFAPAVRRRMEDTFLPAVAT